MAIQAPIVKLALPPAGLSAWGQAAGRGAAPAVWTGHQAWLWHPGILTKYLLADALVASQNTGGGKRPKQASDQPTGQAAGLTGGAAFGHVIVDHDTYHPMAMDLPFVMGDTLLTKRWSAGPVLPGVAACAYQAVGPADAAASFEQTVLGIEQQTLTPDWDGAVSQRDSRWQAMRRLKAAWADAKKPGGSQPKPLFDAGFVAEQLAAMPAADAGLRLVDQAHALVRSIVQTRLPGTLPWAEPVRSLGGLPETLLERLLQDPWAMARAHNQAIATIENAMANGKQATPSGGGVGVKGLHVGVDIVALPLWLVSEQGMRSTVYAQTTGGRAGLVDGRGAALDLDDARVRARLAPKAVLLTAWLRSMPGAGLFIHGIGGGVYDQVTEGWWQSWQQQTLAPMAIATADVHLPMPGVPVADAQDVADATWRKHAARFNVDRMADELDATDQQMAEEKRALLQVLNTSEDPQAKADAFAKLHVINGQLAAKHASWLGQVAQDQRQAETGLANQAVAKRRDWFVGLYGAEDWRALHAGVVDQASRWLGD